MCGLRITRLLLSAAVALACTPVEAADTWSGPTLSTEQQTALARAFAPVLLFHPLEQFFPISPMRRLGAEALPVVVPDAAGDKEPDAGLEAWSARVAGYRALSTAERLQRAALGYRVFPRMTRGRAEIVVEYWSYYVFNEFTVRGTWLPYRIPDNHPHDLERLYLILTPTGGASPLGDEADEAWARRSFRIRSVVANAHDGSIPPNHYDTAADEVLVAPLMVLVERGSHAMAPDIDQDGRFTPGIDSTATPKLQWGIRDTGATASLYRASFMDDRDVSAIRLCGPAEPGLAEFDPCQRYDLYPSGELQAWFQSFELSPRDRHNIFGRSSWLIRTFGDVRLETLLIPSDPPDGSVLAAMERRRIRGQTGSVVGLTTTGGRAPAVILGQRYFRNVGPRRAPDIAVEGVALFSGDRRPVTEGTLWGSYTVDAITNIVVGGGWFSEQHVADLAVGTDLRLGRFTVRNIWRGRSRVFNARVTTTF